MKLKRPLKYYLLRLFRLKACPHKVALGMALGFAPNWVPTFGIGPVLSVGVAKLAKVNIIAAFIGGVIGAPLWPILFLLNYKVGSIFFNKPIEISEIENVTYSGAVDGTVGNFQYGSLQFLTGTIFNILLSFLLIYIIVYMLFKKHRFNILLRLKCW